MLWIGKRIKLGWYLFNWRVNANQLESIFIEWRGSRNVCVFLFLFLFNVESWNKATLRLFTINDALDWGAIHSSYPNFINDNIYNHTNYTLPSNEKVALLIVTIKWKDKSKCSSKIFWSTIWLATTTFIVKLIINY